MQPERTAAALDSRPIIFVGNARCYHTMDWYRAVRDCCQQRDVFVATDLIESEGHVRLVKGEDRIVELFNVDNLLAKGQSNIGNYWRNAVKLLAFPLQALGLRRLRRKFPNAVYHAHTMYYMFVCWMSGIRFIGTPQGSEVLVRPRRSRLYRFFAIRSLRAAWLVTVDSVAMRDEVRRISQVEARIVQNGVDVAALQIVAGRSVHRDVVLSLRGMTSLYRIDEICAARDRSNARVPLTFIYPFWDEAYRAMLHARLTDADRDLGRLGKPEMLQLLGQTMLAISIPSSDSSPRSIYEAVFAGACVATTAGMWLEVLPDCMRARVRVVDVRNSNWFDEALAWARETSRVRYVPSTQALATFDQRQSMSNVVRDVYAAFPRDVAS